VISSASWYITKGIITSAQTKHICYCHTPPRYLYGYPTAVEWQRYWPIKVYAVIVNHFLRKYDYLAAQRVDKFVVNSENVQRRVRRFYGRDSEVVYPPVMVSEIINGTKKVQKEDYFLIVSRVVGAKGIDLAIKTANKLKLKLKIVGEAAGLRFEESKLKKMTGKTVEFLGRVPDEELWELYARAKGFFALAVDEDFGMTVVEAMAAGTPVVAFAGGGYLETVVDGETGVLFTDYSEKGLENAVLRFSKLKFSQKKIRNYARKFSREEFEKKMREVVKTEIGAFPVDR
jgi:glycosyltransferase involved in cell wall biosynthesis